MERYDVIVAGLGAMGSAALYELARRGAKVLGLERLPVPHRQGSYHGHSRVIRQAYFEHPDYVPLLLRAYELWRALEDVASEQRLADNLLTITGGLYLGREDSPLVAGSLASAQQHGLPYESLTHAQVAQRFPQFALPLDSVGMYEPAAGFLKPEAAVHAQLRIAQAHGAFYESGRPVVGWSADAGGISVLNERREYRADTLILCCGAWSNPLLHDAGVTIRPTRQVMGWLQPPDAAAWGVGRLPVWVADLPEGLHYGVPEFGDGHGSKLACHEPGPPLEPALNTAPPGAAELAELQAFARRYLPGAAAQALTGEVCTYENSPDGHFILDRHPRHANVLLACGFSGHGFKFAPVIGEALADLALHGHTSLPIAFLSLRRFG